VKNCLRLLAAFAILVGVMVFPDLASAAGIHCFSVENVAPDQGMICRITCVLCEDQDNGNAVVGESCYDNVCWFGGRPAI
jgi:hypothetical protein